MRSGTPLQTLHEALAAAVLKDLPDTTRVVNDWEAVHAREKAEGREKARAFFDANGYPTRQVSLRPSEQEVDVTMFAQQWGSTALGYGGIGGAAVTAAHSVVVAHGSAVCVYFGGGALAYRLDTEQVSQEQRKRFEEDVAAHQLVSRRGAAKAYGAQVPGEA